MIGLIFVFLCGLFKVSCFDQSCPMLGLCFPELLERTKIQNLRQVRIVLTTIRLWDLRAAVCAIVAWCSLASVVLCEVFLSWDSLSPCFKQLFFTSLSVSFFCTVLLCFEDVLGVIFWACVQLLASSALMSLSTTVWLTLFPRLRKISKN